MCVCRSQSKSLSITEVQVKGRHFFVSLQISLFRSFSCSDAFISVLLLQMKIKLYYLRMFFIPFLFGRLTKNFAFQKMQRCWKVLCSRAWNICFKYQAYNPPQRNNAKVISWRLFSGFLSCSPSEGFLSLHSKWKIK